ncbi:MAG: hypothetical protein RLZZ337_2067, partial [Bacteroidota bacterium]|jgi:F-type H+-transporting ATPase subunit delta
MASSRIAARYSKSLLDLAIEKGQLEQVKSDMDGVVQVCDTSKDLVNLLQNPIVNAESKKAILNKVFAENSDTTKEFVGFLVDKKREQELPLVAQQFIASYDHMKGITKATVVSAVQLSTDTMTKVKKYITGLLGKEEIQLHNEVDSSIIGGIIIKHEDRLLDMSVSKELREIRKTLIYN